MDEMKAKPEETDAQKSPAPPPTLPAAPANAAMLTRRRLFPLKIQAPNRKMRCVLVLYAALLVLDIFGTRAYKQHRLNNELMDAIKAKQGLAVVIRLLNTGADANTTAYDYHVTTEHEHYGGNQTALGIAVERGDIPLALALLGHGANPATRSYLYEGDGGNDYTLLNIAASRDRVAMARFLLDRGLPLNSEEQDGEAPLNAAHSVPMLALFLDRGADINYCDNHDYRPLGSAAASGNVETTRFLLQRGAIVNMRNGVGQTALFQAKNEAVMKVLLQHGADVNAQDHTGATVLSFALRDAMIEEDYETTEEGIEYIKKLRAKGKAQVKFLLLHGADPTLKDTDGDSTLAGVKELGYTGLVKKVPKKSKTRD